MRVFESRDYEMVKEWLKRRNMTAPDPSFLPKIGIIEDGIACGFLLLTDTPIAILEYFISNPYTEKHIRADSLSRITRFLIAEALANGVKSIVCNTKFENIKRIAVEHGFSYVGEYSTFHKEL